MRILMLTGPSGAGKDFVQRNISDRFGNVVQTLCFDTLYVRAAKIAFPYYRGPSGQHRIWHANMDQEIDFTAIFRKAIDDHFPIRSRQLLIQGIQLQKSTWRNAILAAVGWNGSGDLQLHVIQPTPEILLEQRRTSSKPYHATVCDLDKCKGSVRDCEQAFEDCELGPAIIHPTKEDALMATTHFFKGEQS